MAMRVEEMDTEAIPGLVTLETVGGGCASELFQRELVAVVQNIADQNTIAKKARKVVLEVVFTPRDDEREVIDIGVFARAALVPVKPAASTAYLGRRRGKIIMAESNPRQAGLFDGPKPAGGNVRPLHEES